MQEKGRKDDFSPLLLDEVFKSPLLGPGEAAPHGPEGGGEERGEEGRRPGLRLLLGGHVGGLGAGSVG